MTQSIAIIVVNYGSHDLLAKNFGNRDWSDLNARLFVVDNFTAFDERSALTDLAVANGWHVIEMPTNVGFGSGVDVGAQEALKQGYEALLLVNPDVAISPDVVRALHGCVRADPMTMLSPRVLNSAGRVWFDGGELDLRSGRVRTARGASMDAPFAWLSGACLALSADLWSKADGFDSQYFLYWEDVDLSQRVVEAGGRLEIRRDLEVQHDVGGTQGAGKSAVYLHYNTRNRLLFASKWLPRHTVRRWLWRTPIESYRVLVRGGRRSLLEWPMVKAAVSGSLAGARFALSTRRSASPTRVRDRVPR